MKSYSKNHSSSRKTTFPVKRIIDKDKLALVVTVAYCSDYGYVTVKLTANDLASLEAQKNKYKPLATAA